MLYAANVRYSHIETVFAVHVWLGLHMNCKSFFNMRISYICSIIQRENAVLHLQHNSEENAELETAFNILVRLHVNYPYEYN